MKLLARRHNAVVTRCTQRDTDAWDIASKSATVIWNDGAARYASVTRT